MTPFERGRKALEGIDMRHLLEHSDLPVEIATALADLWEEQQVHLPRQMLEALAITEEAVSAQGEAYAESDALALLRELNDALVIPGWLQPRVDALLDRAEEKS